VLVTAAGFVFFLTLPVISASNDSLWQSKVPPGLQGRCFAIQRVLSEAAMPVGYCLAGPWPSTSSSPADAGGALAGSIGQLIGTGAGRGMGLMFIVLGLAMSLVAMLAYSIPALRRADELPDALTQPPPAAEGDAQPA
jgi:hypothetical protein